jgi:hypothetical protein
VVRVDSVDGLLAAIGPQRVIQLAPGDYPLDKARRGIGKHYRWKEAADNEFELWIHDAPGLTIRCVDGATASVTMASALANVLCFEKCDGVELVNLKLGHAPDVGGCIGGVVKAAACAGMTLRNCDLYGCGTEGLTLRDVSRLRFVASVIHDCSYGILTAEDCDDLRFEKSTFRRIEEYTGFAMVNCQGVSFDDCVIEGVELGGDRATLFRTNLSDPAFAVRVKGGAIRRNKGTGLVNAEGMVRLEGVDVTGNSWQ